MWRWCVLVVVAGAATGCGAGGHPGVASRAVPAVSPVVVPSVATTRASRPVSPRLIARLARKYPPTTPPSALSSPLVITGAPQVSNDPVARELEIEQQCQALAETTFTAPPSPTSAGTVADSLAQEGRVNEWVTQCERQLTNAP